MAHDKKNIMIILSSPSGVGKTTLTKKYNKNTNPLKFQFHIQLGQQDLTKLMVLTTTLLHLRFLNDLLRKKILRIC